MPQLSDKTREQILEFAKQRPADRPLFNACVDCAKALRAVRTLVDAGADFSSVECSRARTNCVATVAFVHLCLASWMEGMPAPLVESMEAHIGNLIEKLHSELSAAEGPSPNDEVH